MYIQRIMNKKALERFFASDKRKFLRHRQAGGGGVKVGRVKMSGFSARISQMNLEVELHHHFEKLNH